MIIGICYYNWTLFKTMAPQKLPLLFFESIVQLVWTIFDVVNAIQHFDFFFFSVYREYALYTLYLDNKLSACTLYANKAEQKNY